MLALQLEANFCDVFCPRLALANICNALQSRAPFQVLPPVQGKHEWHLSSVPFLLKAIRKLQSSFTQLIL